MQFYFLVSVPLTFVVHSHRLRPCRRLVLTERSLSLSAVSVAHPPILPPSGFLSLYFSRRFQVLCTDCGISIQCSAQQVDSCSGESTSERVVRVVPKLFVVALFVLD